MAVTAAEIIGIMREVGIEKDIIDQIRPDIPLLTQGLDSIDLPILAFATEKKFGIDMSQVDPRVLKTIDDLVVFVNKTMK